MLSAKKWEMLHPNYEGGDGELLWNVYYGDFAEDDRFNAFRRDQLWDAEVIRPMIEMDPKYERFQLNHESPNVRSHRNGHTFGHHQWMMVGAAAVIVMAVLAVYLRHKSSYKVIAELPEQEALLYGSAQ